MEYDLTVEVRVSQRGMYGNALTLGDHFTLTLNTLSEGAEVLVKLHQFLEALRPKSTKREG